MSAFEVTQLVLYENGAAPTSNKKPALYSLQLVPHRNAGCSRSESDEIVWAILWDIHHFNGSQATSRFLLMRFMSALSSLALIVILI